MELDFFIHVKDFSKQLFILDNLLKSTIMTVVYIYIFFRLIGDCCYKMMESPNMGLVRTKDTRTSLFQIIGTLVKKFSHGLGCSLKLMQVCIIAHKYSQHFTYVEIWEARVKTRKLQIYQAYKP